jgi:autotransporter translocation and assembly factor TamB
VAGWNGRVSGAVSLTGSPGDPLIDIDLHAEPFGYRDIHAEKVDLKGHYADGRFVAQDLRAHMQNVESSARLAVPIRLALGRSPDLPDEPLTGHIDIPAGDLRILPLLVPQLQTARGKFDLSADLGGTSRSPRFQGRGHIRDGVVQPSDRTEVIEGLNADLHFDQAKIVLDTLTARQGRTGRIQSSGVVLLDHTRLRSYRFGLAMRDFAAAEEGLYAVLFDGDFTVSDGPRVGRDRLPQVTGRAQIKKGVIEFDFANQSEVQRRAATTQPLYWTYHIQADATSNLKWRPPNADLEFNADLDLQQTPDSLLIYGEMHSLRGTYWFLSTRFKVLNADLTFDNQQGVDPILDVAAEARVRAQVPAQGGVISTGTPNVTEVLTAQITGRSSKPVIALTSSSNWDQRQILTALTFGGFRDPTDPGNIPGAVRSGAVDFADNILTRQLNAQLSADLSKYFNGALTDWELQRDQGGLIGGSGAYVLGVGSQVTDRLALRYQQRVSPTGQSNPAAGDLFDQNVEAEYRLNRFIFLTSGVTRRRTALTNTTQPTDYNVNLKARWEY